MVAVPCLLCQLKAISYSGHGTIGMASKYITHDYEIEGIESSGPMEVDAPFIIDCASRKKKTALVFCFVKATFTQ